MYGDPSGGPESSIAKAAIEVKRRKKPQTFSIPFLSGKKPAAGRRKKGPPVSWARRLLQLLVVLAAVAALGAIAVGFVYLERYVRTLPVVDKTGPMELVGPPAWLSNSLQDKIAAAAGGRSFPLDRDQARLMALRLENLAWVYNVSVQTTDKTFRIEAKYRKPVAVIQFDGKKYYVARVERNDPLFDETSDQRVVVLDHVPVEKLILPEITGYAGKPPTQPGSLWYDSDVISAVELLTALGRMDENSKLKKPLLADIEKVDITSPSVRNPKKIPVVMYAKDGTEIQWGAAYGESQRYLEATEQEKLASLYTIFDKYGTIRGIDRGVYQIIDLRKPQVFFPRPGH